MNRIPLLRSASPFAIGVSVLAIILGLLFANSFRPKQVVFSNDGPLGVLKADSWNASDKLFNGSWYDLHWIGMNTGISPPCLTYFLLLILGPEGFAAFYPPLALLFLGVAGMTFFRAIGLPWKFCAIGGIAAALNSNYFSNTCWGLGSRATTLGFIFLALAAISARRLGKPWLNAILAGLATGMAVVEGADIGVILSPFVGLYFIVRSFLERDTTQGSLATVVSLALIVVCAGLIALHSISSLLWAITPSASPSKADPQQQEAERWAFTTQWSLPPKETLRTLIPGLYGYRMDTRDGGNYWGKVGETEGRPGTRFSGAGEYAGVLVILVGLWAIASSFVRSGNAFSTTERRMIQFWTVILLVTVVLSWGRYAPAFYKLVYALPYFSSIRNPMKFMHVAHLALMILFSYGLLGIWRRYLDGATGSVPQGGPSNFDRWWKVGMVSAVVLSLFAFILYSSAQPHLVRDLMNAGFPDESFARSIAKFSIAEVGKYLLFLLLSVAAVWWIMGGKFKGKRTAWPAVMLGLLLVIDLARANTPWILYWDYTQKYASNPILDILTNKPYEGRIVAPSFLVDPRSLPPEKRLDQYFPSLYGIEWVQHHFQYYNIQSIDVSQDPRPPADKLAYLSAVAAKPGRYWQLTNTRYILGMTDALNALNNQFDGGRNRFKIAAQFDITPKPGLANPSTMEDLTVVPAPDGALALFEFTGALPRAGLYTNWLVMTNDDAALKMLADDSFDPSSAVIVSGDVPRPSAENTNVQPGKVEIVNYSHRRIELKAETPAQAILLLNDRYDKDWHATVDGKATDVIKCNYIMRGTMVPAGQHSVVFELKPPSNVKRTWWISAISCIAGLLLLIWLLANQSCSAAHGQPTAGAA